jgi:dimethylhistidine N-methyltransferase
MRIRRLLRRQVHERLSLHHLDHGDLRDEFRQAVLLGLSAVPKRIAPKFFYDGQGSELFERITRTEEYYPTRTESWILRHHAATILDAAGAPPELVELGSGSSTKTRWLLNVLAERGGPMRYVAIDISPSVVREFGAALTADYPALEVEGLITDYSHALDELKRRGGSPRLYLFLGSSLGNFDMPEAAAFLRDVSQALGPEDGLLLGVDLVKPADVLHGAYNDREGVTAAFNRNLLARINRELGGQFDLARFRHVAFFDPGASRIEMHLESLAEQEIRIDSLGRSFAFAEGERLHTENSYKYSYAALAGLFDQAGLRLEGRWVDPSEWFAVNLLRAR